MSDDDDECAAGDQIVFTGNEVDGGQEILRHHPDHTIETAVFHPHEDGKPIPPGSEVVSVRRAIGSDRADVTSIYKAPPVKKPAQVATSAYRSGWDRTFGSN